MSLLKKNMKVHYFYKQDLFAIINKAENQQFLIIYNHNLDSIIYKINFDIDEDITFDLSLDKKIIAI